MRRIDAFWILATLMFGALNGLAAEKTVAELARNASPSVMVLHIKDSTGKEIAVGTGFVISPDGLLVTARHVIKSAATAEAQAADRGVFRVVGLCGSDDANDLALLKLDASNLKCLEMTSTDGVQAGEKVVIIGSPLGLDGTVTDGIVSAVRDEAGIGKRLQITAAISPGSSGSPVLNSAGKVVGIASFYLKGGQALNFAIPAELAVQLEKAYRKLSAEESNNTNAWGDKLAWPGVKELPGTKTASIRQPNYWDEILASTEWVDYSQAVGAKDKQKGLKTAQALIKKYPANPLAYGFLGGALTEIGFLREATDTIEAGIKLDNQLAVLWYGLGYAQQSRWLKQEKGFGECAVASFHKAILCDPEYTPAWYGLAYVLQLMGNKNYEAIDAINNALKIDPKNKCYLSMKADLLSVDSQEEAYRLYKELVDADPTVGANWVGYGLAARKLGHEGEAEKSIRKGVDLDFTRIDGWPVLADIYEKSGRKNEFTALWEEIHERCPSLEGMIRVNFTALQQSRTKQNARVH